MTKELGKSRRGGGVEIHTNIHTDGVTQTDKAICRERFGIGGGGRGIDKEGEGERGDRQGK